MTNIMDSLVKKRYFSKSNNCSPTKRPPFSRLANVNGQRLQFINRKAPCFASSSTACNDKGYLTTNGLPYEIRVATTAAELRAAAYLRAVCFYTYPSDRSEFAARSHRRMKADTEWDDLTAKVEGRHSIYKDLEVTCLIAVANQDADSDTMRQILQETDPSAKLPATPDNEHAGIVLGTLDVNQGVALPSELLVGKRPHVEPRLHRAYLSNVCVANGARRKGVAQSLIVEAEACAKKQGVVDLYVHVVSDNVAATNLYIYGSGFAMENQESEDLARGLGRPRRLLLHKMLR